MKKIVNRFYYAVMFALVILVISIVSTGCQSDSGNGYDAPEFVYLPEIMPFPLPDGIDWISNITVAEESVYFTAMAAGDENDPFHSIDIYTMDINGSNIRPLPEYDVRSEFPADAEDGNVQIYSIHIGNTGDIWIAERGEFFNYPDDLDEDDWERWNKRKIVKEFIRVRRLDNAGAEILSFDVSHISIGNDWFYISAFTVDEKNNIYIGTDSTIHVFDSEGTELFTLDVQWIDRFINLQDGSVAYTDWGARGRILSKIDVSGKKTGETIELPNNANNIYPGNDEYSLIFTDNVGLYGIEAESGDDVLLVNWIDSDMTLDGLDNITFLPDGRILVTNQSWNNEGSNHEIIFLTKTPYSELPERTVLTLATFYLDWNIRSVIVEFNRASTTHRIHVTDYSEFNTEDDWQAGLTRLSAEIISGKVPDILDVSNLPFSQYAAKGLLLDLYDFIDSDPDFDRSDFMQSALQATEINGSLYKIFPYYSIISFLGDPSVVGSYPGWNMEEFIAVLNANPDADYPLGQGLTKMNLLNALFMLNMNEYVDWNVGKVSFDSDEFIALLEFANTLPDDFIWENDYVPEPELISSGRQIIAAVNLSNFHDYQMYSALFGGEIVFKGLPAESRNGYSLSSNSGFAITGKCKDADGAWQFLRTFLNEDWQSENSWYGIPVNRHAFDEMLKEAMTENEYGHGSVGWDGFTIELKALTQADADKIMAVLDSASGSAGQDDIIWNIISEGASDFFSGQSSVQDTVRVIQNRTSTYVAEQS